MPVMHDYRSLAQAGMTAREAAELLNVKPLTPYRMAKRGQFRFAAPKDRPKPPAAKHGAHVCLSIGVPLEKASGPQLERVWSMHGAGHPPGVIAMYTGLTRGAVVSLIEGEGQ